MILKIRVLAQIILLIISISLSANPNVMVTGYWNPTGQMIAPFSLDPLLNPTGWIGNNWLGLGYDVYSYFPDPVNYLGDFEIDYQDTSYDFWTITEELHPLAIISFGVGTAANVWEIEFNTRNLINWNPDFEIPFMPTPNPPDNSVSVDFLRQSTLPVVAIASAIDENTTLNGWVDWDGDADEFLCAYIFYHDTWYQAIHNSNFDEYPCLAAGFIHVSTTLPLAQEAAFLTIETTLEYLNTFINVSGSILNQSIDPTGTILTLSGNNQYSIEIDNMSGNFELPYIPSDSYDVTAVLEGYYYGINQVEINEFSTLIDLELENWSIENQLHYAEDPDNLFEGPFWSNYEVMTRYTQDELFELNGSVIGKIGFYTPLNSNDCSISVKVYEANLGELLPSEVIYEHEIVDFESNEYIDHILNLPIPIETDKEYWTGYSIETANGFAGWFDNGVLVENKGGWIKSESWHQLSFFYEDAGNWAIATHVYSPEIASIENDLPQNKIISLSNYPNPFNPSTTISFDLPDNQSNSAEISIFNIKGQKVKQLISDQLSAGQHSVVWNGEDDSGKPVSSGIYFYKLKSGNFEKTKKMLLIK